MVARASTTTHEAKRDQVARAVVGAVAGGAQHVIVLREPFRISTSAVENLRLDAKIEVLDVDARLEAADTVRAVHAMRAADCGALLVLGGDGTHRVVTQAWPDAPMVPLSTGTNNVFPMMCEATTAGAAAGLVASGNVALEEVSRRAKRVHVQIDGEDDDLALIDAVVLVGDRLGSFLPFDPARMQQIVLARAEPGAVGVSPIGGLLHPCGFDDDFGVLVECGDRESEGRDLLVPISPGLYRTARVRHSQSLELGEAITAHGPAVLAFDGDRSRSLVEGQCARLSVLRDGPHIIDVQRTLALAAEREVFVDRGHFHDAYTDESNEGPSCC